LSILDAHHAATAKSAAVRFLAYLENLLLPRDCFLCDAPSHNQFLCADCDKSLPRLPPTHCPVCARVMAQSEICGPCTIRPPSFDHTHAAFCYDFPVDTLIRALKYQLRLACAPFLGNALIPLAKHSRPDLIVPVPLAQPRLAFRGFNQAVELARPLAQHLGVPIARNGVVRCRDTVPQVNLPRKERAANIRNAFECRFDLTGKTVWIVDDVMTTGATLNELAGVLKGQGAARVENFVVARTAD
jgi:ComF family protein